MKPAEVQQFIYRYLQAQGCQMLEMTDGYLISKLSVQADKEIGNRPYYWLFQEKTGAPAETLTLTFIFDEKQCPEHIQGEKVMFGSWRLHQIFQACKKQGHYIRLYEQVNNYSNAQALVPWLFVHYKISFIADQNKDILYPLGINLVSGGILENFDHVLKQYQLTSKIPDYHFTLEPIFSLTSSSQKLEEYVKQFIASQDITWAEEARKRIEEEKGLIHSFFIKEQGADEALEKRLQEVEYYQPRIEVKPINVGLIYLQTTPLPRFEESS